VRWCWSAMSDQSEHLLFSCLKSLVRKALAN
jgi:hypothetical protein